MKFCEQVLFKTLRDIAKKVLLCLVKKHWKKNIKESITAAQPIVQTRELEVVSLLLLVSTLIYIN